MSPGHLVFQRLHTAKECFFSGFTGIWGVLSQPYFGMFPTSYYHVPNLHSRCVRHKYYVALLCAYILFFWFPVCTYLLAQAHKPVEQACLPWIRPCTRNGTALDLLYYLLTLLNVPIQL